MVKNDFVLAILLDYAEKDDNIRAVLLEGSRAFGDIDRYSDYDIVYVTRSSEPYFGGFILPFLTESFGEIAVMQTPDNGDPHDVYTLLVQFASGVRIDLTFRSIGSFCQTSSPFESATAVVLDKDRRFADVSSPNDSDFWLKKPSEADFRNHCNEFWWVSPYVAKAVARGQTFHALELFGEVVRKEYALMLTWLIGVRQDWQRVNVGKHLSFAYGLLADSERHFYRALAESYTRADDNDIFMALRMMMEKYNALAPIVAGALGYRYDDAEAEKTMAFIAGNY